MCLAVPMRIVERNGLSARCVARGVERTVSLFLLQHEELSPGDHVMVHGGNALQKMAEADALRAWELYDEMFAAEADAIAAASSGSSKER